MLIVTLYIDIADLVEVSDLLKTNHFLDTKWLNLGLHLGLLMNTLKTIEAQCEKDVSRCLLECLSLWLQRVDKVDERGGPNWDTLANALSKIGERFSADNARQKGLYKEKNKEFNIYSYNFFSKRSSSPKIYFIIITVYGQSCEIVPALI